MKPKIKKFLYVIGAILLFILVSTVGYQQIPFVKECKQKRANVLSEVSTKTSEFNSVSILSSEENRSADIKEGGDCLDSEPYVTASKEVIVNKNAGLVYDDLIKTMNDQGFASQPPNLTNSACGPVGTFTFNRGDMIIKVVLGAESSKGSSCYPYDKVDEETFKSKDIEKVHASLQT